MAKKRDIAGIDNSPRVKPEDLKDIVCENCGGRFFRQVHAFKRVPALISQSGKEEIVPVPTFRCDDCGHVNEEFMPI